jgi:AmmeMemoRadiSam system protein B
MRNPVVSGAFYESDQDRLKKQIKDCFLSDFGPGVLPEKPQNKESRGFVVPHAGFPYSGPCAAFCYKAIAESEKPDLFIILGTSHAGVGSAVSLEDWKTPLGIAKIDKDFGKALVDAGIEHNEHAHAGEHSIEVQLPFLQFICEDFKFVPVLVADDFKQVADAISKAVEKTKKKVIVLASSDFTHFGANYGYVPFTDDIKENMYKLDKDAIEYIKKLDSEEFLNYIDKTGATICGKFAIAALLTYLKTADTELLKYYTSADISDGDYSFAVGYAAIKFS